MSAPPYLHLREHGIERLPIIDVRSHSEVQQQHIVGTAHIPLDEWSDRSLEFPPRKHRFLLLAPAQGSLSTEQEHTLQRILAAAGTDCAAVIYDDSAAAAANGSVSPFWSSIPPSSLAVGPWPLEEQGRLWQPSPLAPALLHILRAAAAEASAGAERTEPLRLLDAGAGTGRNAVYLLHNVNRQVRRTAVDAGPWPRSCSLHVIAVDNRRAMTEKMLKFCDRALVAEQCTVVQADIVQYLQSCVNGPGGGFHGAAFFRFLDWPALTACLPLLQPWPSPCMHAEHGGGGGTCNGHAWLVLEHFHVESAHPSEEAQKVREGQLLAHLRALAATYSVEGGSARQWSWHVLMEERAACEDGRPLLHVILQGCAR